MDTYGNKTWNNATDNKDKSVIPMAEDTFRKIQQQLENSGINYYAYSKDSKTVMAVNDKDLEWLRSIVGKDADKMEIRKSDVVYTPPQKILSATLSTDIFHRKNMCHLTAILP